MTGPESTTEPTRRRSFASSGLTYAKVAGELNVPWCDGSDPSEYLSFDRWNHAQGYATIHPENERRVHWTDRAMTRKGLRRFLVHAAVVLYPEINRDPDFILLYRQSVIATKLGAQLGVHFPRSYANRDRAKVRLWMRRYLTSDTKVDKKLLRRIRQWTKP